MKRSAAERWSTLTMDLFVLAVIGLSAGQAMGQPGALTSADTAIGIDLDSTFVGPANNGRYPGGDAPLRAIDNNADGTSSKYLNFGGAGSGFIVTPGFASPVESFQIRTGNDAPGRDPASWALYGFNGTLTTTDSGPDPAINQTGLAEAWTLIDSSTVTLPGNPADPVGMQQRLVWGPVVNVNSGGTAYENYKMIFPTMKTPGSIMQIDEIQFFLEDAGSPASAYLTTLDPIIAVDETPTPAGWKACGTPNTDCSNSPGNEPPAAAIDQNLLTEYLNFGEQNSGLIITNSEGPIDVNWMRITTAEDAVERDPASYQLWGTNDPITSAPNSNSNGTEVWTLISSGPLDLTQVPGVLPNGGGDDARHTNGAFIPINSPTNYTSYRLVFPTTKDVSANSMQIADVQFFTNIPEPASFVLFAFGGLALAAVRQRRHM